MVAQMEVAMGRSDDDGILSRIDEALVGRRSMQSPLYRWMMENHDAFFIRVAAAKAEGKRLDWKDLARRFAEGGLTDGTGKAPTAANAKNTWWRVQHARRAQRMSSRPAGELSASRPAASVVGEPSGNTPGTLDAVRKRMNEKSGRRE
jgi:hypothetical protein